MLSWLRRHHSARLDIGIDPTGATESIFSIDISELRPHGLAIGLGVTIALSHALSLFIQRLPAALRFSLIAHVPLCELNATLLQHFSQSRHRLIQKISGYGCLSNEYNAGVIALGIDRDLHAAQLCGRQLQSCLLKTVVHEHANLLAHLIGELRCPRYVLHHVFTTGTHRGR